MPLIKPTTNNAFIKAIFFGNYFYGLCAVGLSIEASLQQQSPLNSFLYYLLVFFTAVFYYTLAYMGEPPAATTNIRSMWYAQHRAAIRRSMYMMGFIIVACAAIFIKDIWEQFLDASPLYWFLLFIFPIVAALYYGINNKNLGRFNLRKIGWLKPFVIGFTWAGFVTIYPVLLYNIEQANEYEPTIRTGLLFIKNFMFVSVLCILFDIKDYATDANHQLKTFVVNFGLRKTIFYIIIPLSAIGLGSFILYAVSQQFHIFKILINTIPFILLLAIANSFSRRRPILYYLIIIDGLMLVKAICGIIAMICF